MIQAQSFQKQGVCMCPFLFGWAAPHMLLNKHWHLCNFSWKGLKGPLFQASHFIDMETEAG